MKHSSSRYLVATIWLFFAALPCFVFAGAFSRTVDCDETGCAAGGLFPSGTPVNPFGVTHPLVFDRAGGPRVLRICIEDGYPAWRRPAERAAEMWNNLSPITGNCAPLDDPSTPTVREGCARFEDIIPPTTVIFAESVLLHELGHCAMALDHPERRVDLAHDGAFELTSFSASWGETSAAGSISAGPDLIRGSSDDTQQAPMGQVAENVSWFRRADNNPFVVDSTIIDRNTFARSIATGLPPGHLWAANGNRAVAELLGFAGSQAVMYGRLTSELRYLGLTSDDVNMVKMARTGED